MTKAIKEQMEKDQIPYVWLSMLPIPVEKIKTHFPNIYEHCLEEGYDVTKECIPVVPAQHYFMGGIQVNLNSKTSMECLYAVGETSCNGVHGANRLASNSLLESLVFAKRSAQEISNSPTQVKDYSLSIDFTQYANKKMLEKSYNQMILDEIKKEKKEYE